MSPGRGTDHQPGRSVTAARWTRVWSPTCGRWAQGSPGGPWTRSPGVADSVSPAWSSSDDSGIAPPRTAPFAALAEAPGSHPAPRGALVASLTVTTGDIARPQPGTVVQCPWNRSRYGTAGGRNGSDRPVEVTRDLREGHGQPERAMEEALSGRSHESREVKIDPLDCAATPRRVMKGRPSRIAATVRTIDRAAPATRSAEVGGQRAKGGARATRSPASDVFAEDAGRRGEEDRRAQQVLLHLFDLRIFCSPLDAARVMSIHG